MGRFWEVTQRDPSQAIGQFIHRHPAWVQETADQLFRLIRDLDSLARPDDAANAFLETVDCPYYPPLHGHSSRLWLRAVIATLLGDRPAGPAPPASADEIEPLAELNEMVGPFLPLPLVFEFLARYQHLQGVPVPLDQPRAELTEMYCQLSDISEPELNKTVRLIDADCLSAYIEPLQKIPNPNERARERSFKTFSGG